MRHSRCEVAHCMKPQAHLVENTGTGKMWKMCAWHTVMYTAPSDRSHPMVRRGLLQEETN